MTQTVTIEHGIPIPSKRPAASSRYPIANMKMGDSFVVKREQKDYVWRAAKAIGVMVTIRTIDRDTVRVWRLN